MVDVAELSGLEYEVYWYRTDPEGYKAFVTKIANLKTTDEDYRDTRRRLMLGKLTPEDFKRDKERCKGWD